MNQTAIRQTTRRALTALIFAIALAAIVAPANASIVAHLNPAGPGHYEWAPQSGGPTDVPLDILLSADDQTGVWAGPTSIAQSDLIPGSASALQGPPEFQMDNPFGLEMVVGVNEGQAIPSGFGWYGPSTFIFFDALGGSLLPEGTPTYLGLRFDLGSGWQYGWIGVTRTGLFLDAFAWGYETEVGVAIAAGAGIPAPGGLALLGLAGLAAGRRRRL